jgi:hypothetical protein
MNFGKCWTPCGRHDKKFGKFAATTYIICSGLIIARVLDVALDFFKSDGKAAGGAEEISTNRTWRYYGKTSISHSY